MLSNPLRALRISCYEASTLFKISPGVSVACVSVSNTFGKTRKGANIRVGSVTSLVELLRTSLQFILASLWWHVCGGTKRQLPMSSFAKTGHRHTVHVHGDRRTFGLMVLGGRFSRSMLVYMMLYKPSSQLLNRRRIGHVGNERGIKCPAGLNARHGQS